MTIAPSIDLAVPLVLQRDGACLREVVARRHGRRRNPARRPPRTPSGSFRKTLTVKPHIKPGRWVAIACQRGCRIKAGASFRSIKGRG